MTLASLPLDVGDAAFSETKSSDIYAIVCKVCDSRIQVTLRNEGETIPCPECFTELHVHGPSKADRARMEKANRDEELALAPAAPRPKQIVDGHGLETETRDLLSPPPKDLFSERANSTEENFSESEISRKPSRAKSAEPKPASDEANEAPKPKAKKKKKVKYGTKEYWNAKVAEADDGKKAPEILTREKIGAVDYATWIGKSFRSPDLIVRIFIGTIGLGFAYWMGDIVHGAYAEGAAISSSDKILRGIIPILLGGGALMFSLVMLVTTLSMVFQNSASGVSVQDDWPGFSPSEWFAPVAFFVFSLWLACIPGALLGLMLALMTKMSVFVLLAGSFSAFMLAPPLYFCAGFNGSPVQVFSKKVVETFGTENVNWLSYTPLAFGSWIIFAIGVGIVMLPSFLFAFAGAAIQVAGAIIYASVIGLFCGRYIKRLM